MFQMVIFLVVINVHSFASNLYFAQTPVQFSVQCGGMMRPTQHNRNLLFEAFVAAGGFSCLFSPSSSCILLQSLPIVHLLCVCMAAGLYCSLPIVGGLLSTSLA